MTTTETTVINELLERVAALEAHNVARDAETADDRAEREGRNGDAEWRRRQLANPLPDPRAAERDRCRGKLRAHLENERWLLEKRPEVEVAIAAHAASHEPSGVEGSIWRRELEVLNDTLGEILHGLREMSSGRLREMARRDGIAEIERKPGLIQTQRRIAELRAELAELSR